jgi:hypothetical protein
MQAAGYFADNVMFSITVPIGFQPGGGMIKLCLSDAAPEFLATFGKDRAAMRQGARCAAARWPNARPTCAACCR